MRQWITGLMLWLGYVKVAKPLPSRPRKDLYPVRLYPVSVYMVLSGQLFSVKAASLSIHQSEDPSPVKYFCFQDATIDIKPAIAGDRILYVDAIVDLVRGSAYLPVDGFKSVYGIVDFTAVVSGPVFITHLHKSDTEFHATREACVSSLLRDPHEAVNLPHAYTSHDALESNDINIEVRIVLQ